ncbi:Copper chaperone CopZ [Saccharicrinis carchari]|uniref:Copper chaperone CopZ n=1 Tax=Saccharicrinis carchari TaxID=1168039 RepID=A0A521BBS0_SACCC|nr:heavy metal-associated domain-containing protein [Saccharicrinis carchari]SMO44441.1 Copper chaperone CopZ [Saccharicrinis carchari]
MKKMKLLTVTLLLFMGMASTFAKDDPKLKKVTYTCNVDCHTCKEKIMKNIPYEKGVKKVEVDIKNQLVTVTFRKDKNTTEKINKAIDKLGYQAKVKQPETNEASEKK